MFRTSFTFSVFFFLNVLIFSYVFINLESVFAQNTHTVTTSVQVTVYPCGDGIVHPGQECDDGEENNIGVYSLTIEGRTCTPYCFWAPYCGDGVVQPEYGEECDDGNNEDKGFCSADCKIRQTTPPPSGGGGGGGGGNYNPGSDREIGPTSVTVKGKAYPNSYVNILKDGQVVGVVSSDSQADFTFTTNNITPGATTMGFWAEDSLGLRSVSYTATFEVSEGANTTVSGVFIPPTIDIDQIEVNPGDVIKIFGQTAPDVDVKTHIHSDPKLVEEITSDEDGYWSIDLDTGRLQTGQHTAKAMFEYREDGGPIISSSFSRAKSFFVGVPAQDELSADLNRDGRVNLADFSILLFHWGTSNPIADINNNGSVGLADFSIMLFQWTG